MGTNNNKGKFNERLKKMRLDRARIKRYGKDYQEEDEIKKNKVKAAIVKGAVLPFAAVIDAFTNDKKKESKDAHIQENELSLDEYLDLFDDKVYVSDSNDKLNVKVSNIGIQKKKIIHNNVDKDVSYKPNNTSRKPDDNDKARDVFDKGNVNVLSSEEKNDDVSQREARIHKLEKDILDLLKKRFIKNINELEMIQSDLYVLSQIDSNDLEYQKCQENVKEIRKIISKIRHLKQRYDYLKDNYDFEYLLGLEDNVLIDKIIELRELCSTDYLPDMVENYKLLDEFKYLYSRIDQMEEKANDYSSYKEKKVVELKERDIDFEEFKNNLVNIGKINEDYVDFVNGQNRFLTELEEKIGNIDSYEEIELRLKGFNELLGNSFKYMGLLLLNPLKGMFPFIATQTLITKNHLKNLRNNLEWEENTRLKYVAIDYESSIRTAINNVNDMGKLVDSTLSDIVKLKREFNEKFGEYRYRFPEYEDTIRKLDKMENIIYGNKVKMDKTIERLKRNEKINANKLKRVRKLNEEQNYKS